MVESLLSWLKKNAPYVYAGFNEPAEKAEIERVQGVLSVELPASLQSFYLLHDGQRIDCSCGPFYGMTMLSLCEIESQWSANLEVQRELELMPEMELDPDLRSASPDKVKLRGLNDRWIPFARDNAGNFLGLDFDPDIKGISGQVINFGNDEFVKYVLGNSFDEFLAWYMQQLSSGNYVVAREEWEGAAEPLYRFDPKQPQTTHFLDVLSHWF